MAAFYKLRLFFYPINFSSKISLLKLIYQLILYRKPLNSYLIQYDPKQNYTVKNFQ